MNEEEWKFFIERLKINHRLNQYKFYKRSFDFINSESQIQINKGGMGLGKTLAISKLIQENKNLFEHFFIATPTSTIKNEWANELNKIKSKYALWIAKGEICIEKQKDIKFKLKNCNDDCEYRKNLEANKEYNQECLLEADNLSFPLNIKNFYDKNSSTNCLLPIIRCLLKRRSIIVGDYFGYLFPSMYGKITEKSTYNSCLIIDEAHLIPQRVSGLLSKSINLGKAIREIEDEISCEYFTIYHIEEYSYILNGLKIIKKIKDNLIKKLKESKNNEGRYTLKDFLKDWDTLSEGKISIDKFRNIFISFIKDGLKVDLDFESNPEHYSSKFIKFLDNWYEKYYDENYSEFFQYFQRKEEEIQLNVKCKNPSEYLENIWRKWEKIIMISGTIPDYNYFETMTGIKSFQVQTYPDTISSYNIKNNVIIYPTGNFTSSNRENVYRENKESLISILSSLTGRTIIYVQSKKDSMFLEEQIKSEFKIYNFSKTEKGFDVDNKLLEELKEKFNSEEKAIAINHITGKVEGQNYQDEDGESVSNIIIYGFPYPRQNLEWKDKIDYYTEKLKNNSLAKQYVSFYPANTTIYQACMRAKRDEKDKPIIILWSKDFAKGSPGHKYTYDELKGTFVYSQDELLNLVKKRENERKDIQ